MKRCTKRTMKGYITKWNRILDEAYTSEFNKNVETGFFGVTGKMMGISVIKGLMDAALKEDDNSIYFEIDENGMYTGKIVIREIIGLYNLGTDYNQRTVQNVLRGFNSNYRELVYVCICFDLNSAIIYDIKELVKQLTA